MKMFLFALVIWSVPGICIAQAQADPFRSLPPDSIVAVVDDEIIRLSGLEAYSYTQDPRKLFQLNQQIYEFRQQMLDVMIGERLLKADALKANLTVDQLLEQRLKVDRVTEAEIQETYSRAGQSSIDLATARPMIVKFLEDRKRAEARERYIQELIAKARKASKPLVIRLQAPRQEIPVAATDPSKGRGAVEVVEFSDFECPYCQKVQPVLKNLLAQFDGKIKLVWKDFPLPNHEFAVPAAAAGRCASEQGMFWQYHDVLFANQDALAPEDLKRHAAGLGLDTSLFNTCLESGKYLQAVAGVSQGIVVPATPTIFINGRMVTGVAPLDTYARIISEELEAN